MDVGWPKLSNNSFWSLNTFSLSSQSALGNSSYNSSILLLYILETNPRCYPKHNTHIQNNSPQCYFPPPPPHSPHSPHHLSSGLSLIVYHCVTSNRIIQYKKKTFPVWICGEGRKCFNYQHETIKRQTNLNYDQAILSNDQANMWPCMDQLVCSPCVSHVLLLDNQISNCLWVK